VVFCSTTFGAGVNATHCPITCPKRQLPKYVMRNAKTNWLKKHYYKMQNIMRNGGFMKIFVFSFFILSIYFYSCESVAPSKEGSQSTAMSSTASTIQYFPIPTGAELLESTEFKNNGIPYMIEQRYRLSTGEIMYAYYDAEGSNSVTIQRIEQTPLLTLGIDVSIPGMPGYREFNFSDDRRRLVQFMKLFKLGEKSIYSGRVKTPSLSDSIFRTENAKVEFKLLLDLYDETWVLERTFWFDERASTFTNAIVRVNKYAD
jgi:hypothetical protein